MIWLFHLLYWWDLMAWACSDCTGCDDCPQCISMSWRCLIASIMQFSLKTVLNCMLDKLLLCLKLSSTLYLICYICALCPGFGMTKWHKHIAQKCLHKYHVTNRCWTHASSYCVFIYIEFGIQGMCLMVKAEHFLSNYNTHKIFFNPMTIDC